jgi:hypothetical protein
MDMSTFYQQTHFLTAFHQKSLEIISFIKYLESLSPDGSQAQADDGISTTLYQHNAELVGLLQTFKEDAGKVSVDADLSFAEQKFTVSLAGIASSDLQTASNTAGFYGFNRIRAKQEADLRKQVVEGCNKMSRLVANMKY